MSFLQGAELFEGQRIHFDGCRGMNITRVCVFLQGGQPGKIHYRTLNPLTQRRHPFNFGKQVWGDYELGDIGDGKCLFESQV